jgi:predicted aspartyl protease
VAVRHGADLQDGLNRVTIVDAKGASVAVQTKIERVQLGDRICADTQQKLVG